MHNGTIWRWNRPVYDIHRGKPHLRVENRVLPAGPTIADVMANGAFYFGLLRMLAYEDEESGLRIKRLWSVRDPETGRRSYADLLDLPEDRRRRLIDQYAKFMEQQRALRKAMADFFAGQQFFDFYTIEAPAEPEVDWKREVAQNGKAVVEPAKRRGRAS